MDAANQPVFIAGPTAVGKSALALELAEKIGGEIISVDSMQVYRGLDIGTAKPSPAERERVPHHLIDVLPLSEGFDAAKFVQLSKAAEEDIRGRGKRPIFCGGTGLYFKAYLSGVGTAPPRDDSLRAELEAAPVTELLAELQKRDPAAYETIDRQNHRRVVRAVEVIRLTGQPFSTQRAPWKDEAPTPNCFGIVRPMEELTERIRQRVDEMFRQGLVAETESLLKLGLEQNPTAMQSIGYRQVVEHLRGERDLPATIELVKIRTRQFAKRQLTWFRRQVSLHWIEVAGAEQANSLRAISNIVRWL
jgi:tRNA dimethylallyltransferase